MNGNGGPHIGACNIVGFSLIIVQHFVLQSFLRSYLLRERENLHLSRLPPSRMGNMREPSTHTIGKTEKGAFARRGGCANVSQIASQNLGKIAGFSFRTSEEVQALLSQICRESESQFRTIFCKYPFSNTSSPNF